MEVSITTPLAVTENPEKVKRAILAMFPQADITIYGDRLDATTSSLNQFKELLKKQQIRDTARQFLQKAPHAHSLVFELNKQAAYTGSVNFAVVDHPLGNILITVRIDDPETLIAWLTDK